jgi:3-hydroxybutyryl-CoA dehydrogenase
MSVLGVLGAGAMGSGIAQVAATYGWEVQLVDINEEAIVTARTKLQKILNRQVEKGRMSDIEVKGIMGRIYFGCILATNTSSLSVTQIAGSLDNPLRMVGIHFFNPAPLMKLVEIIPAVQSSPDVVSRAQKIVDSWGKYTVIARDTPGFIVNKVARPFYSESFKIYEEGIADYATIDWVMKEMGGFRMGPFALTDCVESILL